MSASFVAAYLNELGLDRCQDLQSLSGSACLQELLAEIVPIVVDHKLPELEAYFVQKHANNLLIDSV